ncbi:MAG: hypothetical protein N3C62_01650 [Synergistetes bacterium]|nr:hypothetical protein [Synergistota bacterium]MCX8127443.1 hypothetical protein [Synergistota bacterium]MDW8192306.1 hypothetical protein [Synergistota bacterium]
MEELEKRVAEESWKGEILSHIRRKEEERKERAMYSEEELLEEIKKKWLEILNEFKKEDKIVFAYFRGAEVLRVSFDDSSVRVFLRGLDVSFIDYVEDPKVKRFIEKVFQRVLGIRLSVMCALESKSWESVRGEEI